jgi:hypothetical protein
MPPRFIFGLRAQAVRRGALLAFGILAVATCGPNTASETSAASQGPPIVDSGPSPSASQPIMSNGRVLGWIMRGPGLDPRSGGGGRQVPVSGDPIAARDGRGTTAATAVSAPDGSFTIVLAGGVYAISEGICGITNQIEVRSQTTTRMTLVIPNAC